MTTPRFYQIELLDNSATPRIVAIDLLDPELRSRSSTPAKLIRAIAAEVRTLNPRHRARTNYVEAPAATAELQTLRAYAWGDGTPNTPRLRRHLETLCAAAEIHRYIVRPGNWAEGLDLVGRESTVQDLTEKLVAGAKVHLMAPRRYGKTSVLRAVERNLTSRNRVVIRMDVESVDTLVGLAVRLADEALLVTDAPRSIDELRAWPSKTAGVYARTEACKELSSSIRSNAVSLIEGICRELAHAGGVLLIDEFTRFLLETMPGARRDAFLRALAALASSTDLPVMVCGSQGLQGFIEWHQLEPLRTLDPVLLCPLEDTAARVLAEELFYGEGHPPSADAVPAVLDAIGVAIPYFVHGLVHHTLRGNRSERCVVWRARTAWLTSPRPRRARKATWMMFEAASPWFRRPTPPFALMCQRREGSRLAVTVLSADDSD